MLKQSNHRAFFIYFSVYLQRNILLLTRSRIATRKLLGSEIFERYFRISSFRALSTVEGTYGPYAPFEIRCPNFAISSNRGEEIREIPRESRGNNEIVMETRLSPPPPPSMLLSVASTVLKGRLFRLGQVCLTGARLLLRGNAIPEFPAPSLSPSIHISTYVSPPSPFLGAPSPRKPPFA